MKPSRLAFLLLGALLLAYVGFDVFVLSTFEKRFKALERERIVTSNQLATAKIIAENLNHVQDLVFKNMDFVGNQDTTGVDMGFFQYLSQCANDLKLQILRVQPLPKTSKDRVTTFGYEVEMQGDFFSFGEFCSKLENNRRILTLAGFELTPLSVKNPAGGPLATTSGVRALRMKMRLNTYRVRK